MKLQKLLYYMQGYHVGALAQPLFPEDIEAWAHGPWFGQYGTYTIRTEPTICQKTLPVT